MNNGVIGLVAVLGAGGLAWFLLRDGGGGGNGEPGVPPTVASSRPLTYEEATTRSSMDVQSAAGRQAASYADYMRSQNSTSGLGSLG